MLTVIEYFFFFFLHSIDWTEDKTWPPGDDTGDVSYSEEEETIEGDSDEDDSDNDYIPNLCVQ